MGLLEAEISGLLAALQMREERLLDVKEVSRRTTLSRTRIHVLERAGRFPKRRRVSGNKVAWLESEIAAWIASRPTADEGQELPD
jgi:prophage regulatory protein